MLYAIVAVLVLAMDQWVKYWVAGNIPLDSLGETFIPGFISLVNLHNDGAAFGFLSGGGARIYFIILTGVFTVAVIIALATNFISGRVARWSIVIVTAGGLSNCIDRVIFGYVQDMFKFELPFLSNFPIFNIADIFITVFCVIFAIAIIFEKDGPANDYNDEFEQRDDEEADRPKLRTAKEPKEEKQPRRKSRRSRYEDEYEQYKAARAARQPQQQPAAQGARAPQNSSRPAYNPADPFAEWEKANARVEAQQKNSPAARAAGINPGAGQKYTAPKSVAAGQPQRSQRPAVSTERQAQPSMPRPVRPQQPAAPVQNPVVRPQQPVQQVPVPQVTPAAEPVVNQPAPQVPAEKPAASSTDFSLDDILAEFK